MTETWCVVEQLGEGTVGVVHGVVHSQTGECAAIKEVINTPGAERELLAQFAPTVRNVIPIVEHVVESGNLLMRMPRAEKNLREHLDSLGGSLPEGQAVALFVDLATALKDVGRVFHRDIKPENILYYQGNWCLSDFGTAKAADAHTATHTWKDAALNAYAAPERWNDNEFAQAGDVYSVGVVLYEALTGQRPFLGPSTADFKAQHTTWVVPPLVTADRRLAGLVEQMLDKIPGRRPGADAILDRVTRIGEQQPTQGRQKVQEAILDGQRVRREAIAEWHAEQEVADRRGELHAGALQSFLAISGELLDAVVGVDAEIGSPELGDYTRPRATR
ncbi:protein kinase domain-containing protein [Nocardia salmonicida]|uniref:protein kinase domain-containing protein n=1 Tax=Nocardia salmonicida TaxID=53431 RepID=UPI0033C98F6C